jgi:hypothetical protein
MIKYHGTPLGGTGHDAIKFLDGRHALVSFAHQQQLPEVLECCESFCLDNGAFTIWKTTGGKIDLEGYKSWVDELGKHPSFDFALIPDVIMGTEEENDTLLSEWKSTKDCVPVFHLGESIDRFFRLAQDYKKVALGSTSEWGVSGSKDWWTHMANFMDNICDKDGYSPVKLHGLRMLDIRIFQYLPLHSGDSTNAGVNGHLCMKKGTHPAVKRWQGNERIAQKIEAFQSSAVWDRKFLVSQGVLDE